jgi:periplasmic protein TonB
MGDAIPLGKKEMKMSAANEGALHQQNLGLTPKSRALPVTPPVLRANTGVFATALIEEDARSRGKRAAQTGIAMAVQVAIVCALLIVPLFVTEAIDLHKIEKTMLIAPPPPAAPSPPVVHSQPVAPKQTFMHPLLTAPTVIPKQIAQTASDIGAAAPSISDVGGVAGGTGDVLGASLGPAPPPPAAVSRPKGPIRISTGMKEPRLLFAPPVVYSPIAKQAHIEGVVVLEAVIDEQGNVTHVQVISGPALLLSSAMKAVAERRYEPTLLDGEPVAIRLDVKVQFRLS